MATLARSNTAADGELASIFGLQHHNMHATSAHHATGPAVDCLVQNNCMSSMQEESFYRESRYPFTRSSQSSCDNNCGSTSENAIMLLGNKSSKVVVVQDPHPLHHHAYSSSQGGGGSPSPGALTQGSGSPFELLRAISPFTPAALIRSDREPIFGDSIRQASSPDGLDGLLRTMQQQQAGGLEHLTVGFDTPSQHFDHDTPPPAPPSSSWTNDHMGGVGFQGRESDLYHLGTVVHQEPTALQQNGSWMVPDGSNGWLCANWNASSSGGGGAQNHNSMTILQQQQQQQQQQNCGLEEEDVNADSGRGMIPEQSPSSMGVTGLQLVHLLLACAEAVANEQVSLAHVILVRLSSLVVQRGNTMQRLAAVFMDALAARVMKATDSGPYRGLAGDISVPVSDMLEAYSVLYESTPLGKFAHLTCNQILLDAVERENCIHVLDLDIWHGMQWPAFLQALALRPGGPPRVRMTAVGASFNDLEVAREKLQEYATKLQVPFEFCPIVERLVNFHVGMVQLHEGEVLVINTFIQLHRLLIKGDEKFQQFLCDLRSLNPRVVALAENDGDHNSPVFLHRFVECLRYYSAIFDAFETSLQHNSLALLKIEQIFSGQKIRNIIACEGSARVERHESMLNWSRRMEAAGFRGVQISTRAFSQAHLLLSLYFHSGFTLNSEHGYLVAGWYNVGLMGVSAWC